MDLWVRTEWSFYRLHCLSHHLLEEKPFANNGALLPHVRQNGDLFLHRCLVCPLAESTGAGPMGISHALDHLDNGLCGDSLCISVSRKVQNRGNDLLHGDGHLSRTRHSLHVSLTLKDNLNCWWVVSSTPWECCSSRATGGFHLRMQSGTSLWRSEQGSITTPSGGTYTALSPGDEDIPCGQMVTCDGHYLRDKSRQQPDVAKISGPCNR